jgi:putative ABC transport system substrate-binding protein
MTGVALLVVELVPKRLELVLELVPNATGIGALINPKNSNAGRNLTALQDAAREKGVQLHIVEASAEADFEKAFASLASLQAGALVVGADPFFNARRSQIVALAAQHSLPTIYEWREFVDAGGLISYGTASPECTDRSALTSVGYSVAKSPPICQSSNRPPSSWSSISRPPRRSI